jgi:hypothetical protein
MISRDKLAQDMETFYTPFEQAKEEIWRRWNDKELRKHVDCFLNEDIPEIFRRSPRATLARHVSSPNFELLRFKELAEAMELMPLCLEYTQDKFVAENIDKYYLCKLLFRNDNCEKGGSNLTALKIISFNNAEGQKICDLETIWGEKLVDFHHRLIELADLGSHVKRFDISDCYKRNGTLANKYYTYFFSLHISYGVLFENYLLDKRQINFTRNVVLPNYKRVLNEFGLKPLIVRLGPAGDEGNLYWRQYPQGIKHKINDYYGMHEERDPHVSE